MIDCSPGWLQTLAAHQQSQHTMRPPHKLRSALRQALRVTIQIRTRLECLPWSFALLLWMQESLTDEENELCDHPHESQDQQRNVERSHPGIDIERRIRRESRLLTHGSRFGLYAERI